MSPVGPLVSTMVSLTSASASLMSPVGSGAETMTILIGQECIRGR